MEHKEQEKKACVQAGYLPVPLKSIPAESLAGLELYLANGGNYSLYSAIGLDFSNKDKERLLQADVVFIYVSVKDHRRYYETMENALQEIISDQNIQREKKSEILYSTSIELSNQLLSAPPDKKDLQRASRLAQNTVQLIMKDNGAFGSLFDAFNHDFYTASHMVNVCSLTIALAGKMGLAEPQILQNIGTGGLLHDIGKIFIPTDLLNTPDKLTKEQFELIKSHVTRGGEHLQSVANQPSDVMSIVTEHHERIDGSGYPQGLKHEQISPMGRLAAIVDSFDAMTSVRPYRSKTFSIAEALQIIEDETHDKYDREIFFAFSSMIEKTAPDSGDGPTNKNNAIKISLKDKDQQLHYYFRMPMSIRRVKIINGKVTMGNREKVIGHKISCVGVGFLSDRKFNPDDNLILSYPQIKALNLDHTLAIVTRCQDHGDGWYTVDAQFPKPYPTEVIDRIKNVTVVREISALVDAN